MDDAMRIEWEAWLATNKALAETTDGGNWDDAKFRKLHTAIVLWGEQLAALRKTQTDEIVAEALTEGIRRFRSAR